MKVIEKEEVRKLIQDRIHDPNIQNVAVCINQRGQISLFRDMIERVFQGQDLYVLVPKKSERDENGKWLHDMVDFEIYLFDKSKFELGGIESLNHAKLLPDKTSVNLSSGLLVYNADKGKVEEQYEELNPYQKVCLELRLPISGLVWLDDLIKVSNKLNNK